MVNFWLFSLSLNEWINTIFPVLLRGSSQLNSTRLMIFNVLYNFSNFKFICGTFLWYARAIVVYFKYFLFCCFFWKGYIFLPICDIYFSVMDIFSRRKAKIQDLFEFNWKIRYWLRWPLDWIWKERKEIFLRQRLAVKIWAFDFLVKKSLGILCFCSISMKLLVICSILLYQSDH